MAGAIIYHQVKVGIDCPDGIAAAWVAWKANPNSILIGCCYGDVPDISGFNKIIIVDFSFPAGILEQWADQGKEILVIDHHKTAMQDLSGLSDRVIARFDMQESGATLTWKEFFPNKPVPAFLQYVKDRDLWRFDLDFSKEIHESISYLKSQRMVPEFEDKQYRAFQIFNMLEPMDLAQLQQIFAPLGFNLLKPKRNRISFIAQSAKAVEWGVCMVQIVEVSPEDSRLISDLCSYLYKQHPQCDFVCAYYQENGGYNLSFRSDQNGNNYDVSAVAKALGGGGHHNASGARASSLPWEK